eukprot:s669_g7.t1
MVEDQGCITAADPEAALKDLHELRARSTTQFKDIADTDPVLEDMAEEPPTDYEPSILDDSERPDGDEEMRMPLPGIVSSLLSHGDVERERTPRRPRRMSEEEPEPTPGSRHDDDDDENPGDGPGGEAPSSSSKDHKRKKETSRKTKEKQNKSETGGTSWASATGATAAPMMTEDAVNRPVEVPVPDEVADGELVVDEVLITEVDDLPDGWIVVDDHMELADAWVVQNLRKNEANERAMTSDERAQMTAAKAKELTQFFQNEVWEFADNMTEGDKKRIITARWVLTWKVDEETGLPRAKARLVLRGFEDPDLTKIKTTSPTAGRTARQIFLTIAGNNMWILVVGDVTAAFLSGSGSEFKRRILVRLPADCGPILGITGPCFMKMNKSAYGLSDAPLLWFNEASRRLKKMHIYPQKLDSCFFAWYDRDGVLRLLLLLHVDDMLIGYDGNSEEAIQKVEEIHAAFNFGKWKMLKSNEQLAYCGGVLRYDNNELILSFEDYIKKVMPVTVDKNRGEHKMTDKEVLSELNKTLRSSKQNSDVVLRFPVLAEDWKDIHFVVFSDAALGVRQDLASQGGFLILAVNKKVLQGEVGRYSVIAWRSYKLTRICRSSLAAESQSCATAIDELMIVKSLYGMLVNRDLEVKSNDLAKGTKSAAVIDARALYDAINKETIQSSLDKRVAIETLVIRDSLKFTNSDLRWVSSERQMADGLTKIGGRQQMCDLLRGGYIQLIYDGTFTASKKKSIEERREINKVDRGTAVAMYVSTVVASQITGATASVSDALTLAEVKITGYYNNNYEYLDLMTDLAFAFAIMILLIMLYFFAKFFVSKNAQDTEVQEIETNDRETQTERGEVTNIATISYDEQMQLGAYIGQLETQLEKYKDELHANLADYVQHIDAMCIKHAAEIKHQKLWVTSHGERWHQNEACPAIADRHPRQLTFCPRCYGGQQEAPFSPM